MGKLKNILLFSLLLLGLLFTGNVKATESPFPDPEKTAHYTADDNLHASAFLEPQASDYHAATGKTYSAPLVKWLNAFCFTLSGKHAFKAPQTYHLQDINRCQKVSLLLFPYHFFW